MAHAYHEYWLKTGRCANRESSLRTALHLARNSLHCAAVQNSNILARKSIFGKAGSDVSDIQGTGSRRAGRHSLVRVECIVSTWESARAASGGTCRARGSRTQRSRSHGARHSATARFADYCGFPPCDFFLISCLRRRPASR